MGIYNQHEKPESKKEESMILDQNIYPKKLSVHKEESEATAFNESTSGAKLTGLGTSKPVNKPKSDYEKVVNENFEKLNKQIKTVNEALKNLINLQKMAYPNFIKTIELTSTTNTRINFGIDTNSTPIVKIVVNGVGAGLNLSLNGNDYFSATFGDVYQAEIKTIDYNIADVNGKAYITVYARIDK